MVIVKTHYKPDDRNGWLDIRNKFKAEHKHGGSDVGKIFDANEHESAYTYFHKITGALPQDDPDRDNEAMRQGRDGEEYVAQRFEEVSGKKVHRENCVFTNDKHPNFFATIDRKIANEDSGLECKNHRDTVIAKYRNRVFPFPLAHYFQIKCYMMVTECTRWYLAIRVYGTSFNVYMFTRHADDQKPEWCDAMYYIADEEFDELEAKVADFNAMLDTGKWAWPLDASKSTAASIGQTYTGKLTEIIELKADLVQKYREAREATKAAEEAEKKLKHELELYMGERHANTGTVLIGQTVVKITFKDVTTSRLNEDCILAATGKPSVPAEWYKPTTAPQMRVYEKAAK